MARDISTDGQDELCLRPVCPKEGQREIQQRIQTARTEKHTEAII